MSENPVPNSKEIAGYVHCRACLSEGAIGQAFEVGRTPQGYQVWCRRHDCNVLHVGIKKTGEVILNTARAPDPEPHKQAERNLSTAVDGVLDTIRVLRPSISDEKREEVAGEVLKLITEYGR